MRVGLTPLFQLSLGTLKLPSWVSDPMELTASVPELLAAMVQLFATAPWSVKAGLRGLRGREAALQPANASDH